MRRWLLRLATGAYLVGVAVLLVRALLRDPSATADAVSAIGLPGLVAATGAAFVGLAATGLAWRSLLNGFGSELAVADAFGVFFVAQAGKYLPGSVWPYLAQVRLAGRFDVAASRALAAGAAFVALHLATGVLIGVPLVGAGSRDLPLAGLLLVAALLLVLVHPAVSSRLLAAAERRVLRGQEIPPAPSGRPVVVAGGWLAVAWIAYGASLLALTDRLAEISVGRAVGSFALAWTLGFLGAAVTVVLAPAGFGVREASLIALLSPVLPPGTAPAVAVASRLAHTAADGLWALVGSWLLRRRARTPASPG